MAMHYSRLTKSTSSVLVSGLICIKCVMCVI